MPVEHLTELQYSRDTTGPWRLYIYGQSGYHTGGQWFGKTIRYPDKEISIPLAKSRALKAVDESREVRITDGGDMLVFHSRDGKTLYPTDGSDFWKSIEPHNGGKP